MRTRTIDTYHRNLYKLHAADRLIKNRDCSTKRTDEFDTPRYGEDLNILDPCRKWLFEQQRKKGWSYERARIFANKQLLYVNSERLEKMTEQIISEFEF